MFKKLRRKLFKFRVWLYAMATLPRRLANMSISFDRLTEEVHAFTTVADSFLAYHDQLVAELRANANDPTAVNALADELAAKRVTLANAMTANTAASSEPAAVNPSPAPVDDTPAPVDETTVVTPTEGEATPPTE